VANETTKTKWSGYLRPIRVAQSVLIWTALPLMILSQFLTKETVIHDVVSRVTNGLFIGYVLLMFCKIEILERNQGEDEKA